MSFNLNILSRAKHAWQYRSEPEEAREFGLIFWRALLVFAFVIFVLALWSAFQELNAVSAAENATAPAATPTPPWTPAKLQTALNGLTERQEQYQTLSASPASGPADPSK